jgi:protein ImuA
MLSAKAEMIRQLRADILIRQGLQKIPGNPAMDMGLGMINRAFPGNQFPLAAVHEFVCTNTENKTASAGFIAALVSSLMKQGKPCLWVSTNRHFFPPALTAFGIDPSRIVFMDLVRDKEILWVMEEALKCDSLCAVIADIRNLDFTASRRLQLAVEQSKTTGFILRQTNHLNTTACVSRWRISPVASYLRTGMPGIGYPRWHIELLKIRNGQPGHWTLEWRNRKFKEIAIDHPMLEAARKIV